VVEGSTYQLYMSENNSSFIPELAEQHPLLVQLSEAFQQCDFLLQGIDDNQRQFVLISAGDSPVCFRFTKVEEGYTLTLEPASDI
jgi:hypothetical protein